MKNWIKLIPLLLMLGAAGCQTVAYRELNGVSTLTEHPQFPAAAQSAPEWTREALKRVAELEFELEKK
jgi:hypothetical protein